MPIRPFLAGQAFDAFGEGLRWLSLKTIDDATTRVIAEKIIELAPRGVRDASSLTAVTRKSSRAAASQT
jgi:hypothetical protein